MESDSAYFTDDTQQCGAEGLAAPVTVYTSDKGASMVSRTCIGGEAVAVKSLKSEYRGVPFYEEALRKEAAIMSGLDHPGICKYVGYREMPGLGNSLLLQWVEGVTLTKMIDDGLTPRQMRKIFMQLCDALQYIHERQIAHKDLKPDNILISRNGQDVKLIDFGFSDADWYVEHKAAAGTLRYAPPEQLRGKTPDVRSDIWALGMVISDMAESIGRRATRRWRGIVSRCLKPLPEERFQSIREVRAAFLAGERRRRVIPLVACAATAAAAVVCTIWLTSDTYAQMRERRETRHTIVTLRQVILDAGGASRQ